MAIEEIARRARLAVEGVEEEALPLPEVRRRAKSAQDGQPDPPLVSFVMRRGVRYLIEKWGPQAIAGYAVTEDRDVVVFNACDVLAFCEEERGEEAFG